MMNEHNKFWRLCCLGAAGACILVGAYKYTIPTETIEYRATVGQGSTVWNVVAESMEAMGDHRSIEEVMYYVRERNQITPEMWGSIEPGTEIIIPLEIRAKK